MKRVGIVTLAGRFNYGNRLQNYAVYKIYEKLGCESVSLYLTDRLDARREIKNAVKRVMGISIPNPEASMSLARLDAFDRFNSLIPHQELKTISKCLYKKFDFFSVGSDQVWNPGLIKYNEDWYFLRFARPEQRIALAVSIGLDELNKRQAKIISNGASGFSSISIRELRGAELLHEMAGIDATIVCDPTLVLSADEWCSIADDRLTPDNSYIFTYLLGGQTVESSLVLKNLYDFANYKTVSLSDRQKPDEPDAGPSEFISLVRNASHVVTDSFHAAVFACIFGRPLTIVHREGTQMFSRLENLARILKIKDKVFDPESFDLSLASEYQGVDDAIRAQKNNFLNYIGGRLNA